MEYKDIQAMLDAKQARESALAGAKQIAVDVDKLNSELKTLLFNQMYDLQGIIKEIFSNLSAYGLSDFESTVNAIAFEVWKRNNQQPADRLEQIKSELSQLNHRHTEAISEACQVIPFKIATTDQMKLRDEVAETIYNNTGIC